ncbi:hypothetical protein Pelo_2899 [Pelomyxa schiedti]|nr:hypothetical protein Pelo_2899 [Pelomyxa schiedti]
MNRRYKLCTVQYIFDDLLPEAPPPLDPADAVVHLPEHTAPPPSRVLAARDQFVALGAGLLVPRCGRLSPARALHPSLLADHIGRPWVVPSAVVLRLGDGCWAVEFSHTGGVLGVSTWALAVGVAGWLSANLVAVYGPNIDSMVLRVGREAVATSSVCVLFDGFLNPGTGIVCNSKWGLAIAGDGGVLMILMKDGDSNLSSPEASYCSSVDGFKLLWVDFTQEKNTDEAAISASRGVENFLLLIDIKETHSSGTLRVKRKYLASRNFKGSVLFSDKHKFILPKCISTKTTFHYEIRSLLPHQVLRKCTSEPHKVDSRHFVEVTTCNHNLEVFSTDDFVNPCNVIHNETRVAFLCGAGFIAFLDEDGRIDIVDALTGNVVLSQPGFPGFQHSFALWHVM